MTPKVLESVCCARFISSVYDSRLRHGYALHLNILLSARLFRNHICLVGIRRQAISRYYIYRAYNRAIHIHVCSKQY